MAANLSARTKYYWGNYRGQFGILLVYFNKFYLSLVAFVVLNNVSRFFVTAWFDALDQSDNKFLNQLYLNYDFMNQLDFWYSEIDSGNVKGDL